MRCFSTTNECTPHTTNLEEARREAVRDPQRIYRSTAILKVNRFQSKVKKKRADEKSRRRQKTSVAAKITQLKPRAAATLILRYPTKTEVTALVTGGVGREKEKMKAKTLLTKANGRVRRIRTSGGEKTAHKREDQA